MKKTKIFITAFLAIIVIPVMAYAQNTSNSAADPTDLNIVTGDGGSAEPPGEEPKIPGASGQPPGKAAPNPLPVTDPKARKVNLIITITSSGNNRFLGDVDIKIDNIDIGKTPDPPPPRGYTVPAVPSGKHEIIAERKLGSGYKIYDEIVNIPDAKSNYELSVKLVPAAGTYSVKDSDIRQANQSGQYMPSPSQWLGSQYPAQSGYNQNNPQGWNNAPTVYNPLNNYPNPTGYGAFGYPSNQYGAYGGLQGAYNNQPGYGQQSYGQQGSGYPSGYGSGYQYPTGYNFGYQHPSAYYLSSNQAHTVQFKITADTSKAVASDIGIAEIKIYDAQNVNSYNLQSAVPYLTSSDYGAIYNRYGCLSPNKNYILQIDIKGNGQSQFQPIRKGFASPNAGDIVEIYIDWGAVLSGEANAIESKNTQAGAGSADPNFLVFQCPYSYYQSQNLNGPGIFSDPTINLQNMGDYQIARDYRNGNYYLANANNSWDSRRMTFVDRGDGLGGLAFISASPNGYFGLSIGSGGDFNFYVGLYNRSTSGELSFSGNQLYQTHLSPTTYANYTHESARKTFPKYYASPQTATKTTTKTPAKVIPQTTTDDDGTLPQTTTDNGTLPQTTTDDEALPQTVTDSGTLPQTTTESGTLPQTITGEGSSYIDSNAFLDPNSWYSRRWFT